MPARKTWLFPTSFAFVWLDDGGHGNGLHLTLGVGKVRQEIREVAEDGNAYDTQEENDGGPVIGGGQLFPLQGFLFPVYVVPLFRVLDHFLEIFIIRQVLAPVVADEGRAEDADEGSRHGNRQDLEQGILVSRCRHEAYDGHYSHRYGRSGNAHLGSDGRNRHGPFGTNIFFDGNIINNGEHGVYHVTRTAEHRQEPGSHRCQYGNMLRIVPQEPFRRLQHHRETTGGLQEAGTGHHGENGQHDTDRRRTGLEVKNKSVHHEADAGNHSQPDASVLDAHKQAGKQHNKPQNQFHSNPSINNILLSPSDEIKYTILWNFIKYLLRIANLLSYAI